MSDSTVLLNQGTGYLSMKKIRKAEQEKSLIMTDNNSSTIDNDSFNIENNSSNIEGFESMDSKNSLANLQKEEQETFNKLKSQFDEAMGSYTDVQQSIHEDSMDYIEKEKNKLEKNVYSQLPEKINPNDIQDLGCYNDRWRRAVRNFRGFMSKEDCAQVAADTGDNIFSLQYGGRNPGRWWLKEGETYKTKGYCFTGNNLNEAKKYGEGRYASWRWALSWQGGYRNRWKNRRWRRVRVRTYWGWRWRWRRVGGGNDWYRYRDNQRRGGGVRFRISDKAQLVISWKNNENVILWTSYNRPIQGQVEYQKIDNRDYGGNDIGYWRNKTVQECQKICNRYGNCIGHNYGKHKNCWVKYGFSGGSRSNYWTFYKKQQKPISSFLTIQDDGNAVLYKGTPNNRGSVIFSFRTNYYSNRLTKNDYWLKYRKYGKNYITNNDYLAPGQFIASNNGKYILYFGGDGNLLVGGNMLKCYKNEGVNVGGSWANSLYSIPKQNVDNIGKGFYMNEDGYKYLYPQKAIRYGTTYKLAKENFNTWGNDLGWRWVKTIEQAKAVCNTDPKCAGFVFEKVSEYPGVSHGWNRVWKKNYNSWPSNPKAHLRMNNWCDIYVRDVKFDNNYSCNENVDSYVSSTEFDKISGGGAGRVTYNPDEKSYPGSGGYYDGKRRSQKQSQDDCNNDPNCLGYIYERRNTSNGVSYKYKYKGYRRSSNYWDTYEKKTVKESGMDGVMNKNMSCSIKKSTATERNILEKKKVALIQRMNDILKEMRELVDKSRKINSKTVDGREDRIRMVYEYEQSFKDMEQEEKDLQVLNKQEQDEEFILTSENYKYISFSIIAILILVATFKIMRKQ
jgi:hypothetical protein